MTETGSGCLIQDQVHSHLMSSSMSISGCWQARLLHAEEQLEMRDSIWWELPFRSNHIKYELVNCRMMQEDGAGVALLYFFCVLCSHPLHVPFLPIATQPEGIRKEKTQTSLVCTKGKGLTRCCSRGTDSEVGVHTLPCSARWCCPSPFPQSCPNGRQCECYSSIPCCEIPVWSSVCHFSSVCAAVNSDRSWGKAAVKLAKGGTFLCKTGPAFPALVLTDVRYSRDNLLADFCF